MNFYTSVVRQRDKILCRGYENNKRIKKEVSFKPTLYVDSKTPYTKFTTIDKQRVEPVTFETMSDANEFVRKYSKVPNFNIYGMNNFVTQFIYSTYGNITEFDPKLINVTYFDIEVQSNEGFPEPDVAKFPIISIALKSNQSNIFYVWGLGDYDTSKSIVGEENVVYVKCAGETDLVMKFIEHWRKNPPDIVSGYNTKYFDVPYLVNRTKQIIPGNTVNKLSPWGMIGERTKRSDLGNKELSYYDLVGIEHLDYMDLMKTFPYAYGMLESYKLDHVAYVVLGEKKLSYEEHGNLHTLYAKDHQKFIDYNIRDTDLIERIEHEAGLINLCVSMSFKAGCNIEEALGTTGKWDSYIYKKLTERGMVSPGKIQKPLEDIPGGFVKVPTLGRHSWVLSFDLNSLYPHLMMQYGMSPETFVTYRRLVNLRNEGNEDADILIKAWDHIEERIQHISPETVLENKLDPSIVAAAKNLNMSIAGNGTLYEDAGNAIIPDIISGLYKERKQIKKKMLSIEQEIVNSGETPDLKRSVNLLNSDQMSIKIMMNALYGAVANRWFRYYNADIAKAITLSGQLSIKWAEAAVNNYMNELLKTSGVDYVVYMDTDSIYVNFEPIVKLMEFPEDTPKIKIVEFLDTLSETKFIPMLKEAYAGLALKLNAVEDKMVMEREVIADRGIWTAKKRYMLNVHNSEGVQYDKPKLKIMGIEAVKSSTPEVCRKEMKSLFRTILNGTETETQREIRKFKTQFCDMPAEDIAFPRGVNNLEKFRKADTIYGSGTPIHVRGSLLYNYHIKDKGLDKQYELIKSGEKIKFIYLKLPNSIKENVISFFNFIPDELNLNDSIDYDLQFEKTFLSAIRPILESVGWSEEKKATLDAHFI
jgi:DNA polymerase elongation subunit (family B)